MMENIVTYYDRQKEEYINMKVHSAIQHLGPDATPAQMALAVTRAIAGAKRDIMQEALTDGVM